MPNQDATELSLVLLGLRLSQEEMFTGNVFKSIIFFRFVPFKEYFLSLPAGGDMECKCGLSTGCMCTWD